MYDATDFDFGFSTFDTVDEYAELVAKDEADAEFDAIVAELDYAWEDQLDEDWDESDEWDFDPMG